MKIKSNLQHHLEPILLAIALVIVMCWASSNARASTAVPERYRLSLAPAKVKVESTEPSKVVTEATPKDDRRADVKR